MKEGIFVKIKYNKPNDLFDYMYESNNIASNKNKIYQTKKYSNNNSFKKNVWTFIGYLILFIMEIIFYIKTKVLFALVLSIIFGIIVLILGVSIIAFIYFYYKTKNSILSGELTINKDGIIDDDGNINIMCKWENVSYILIGELSINVILNNSSYYLRLPIDIKEELLHTIDKYYKVEVVDLTTNN